jgi:hypothetical protein
MSTLPSASPSGFILKMFWDDIIDASDPRWMDTLRRFPRHDFHHLPGYVALEAERRGAHASAYVLQSAQGAFMVPLIESPTPLTLQPWGSSAQDALAPYGYAGPLVAVEGDDNQREKFTSLALARLVEYLRCRNVCSLLLRFHPLIPVPMKPFQALGQLVAHGETVNVDLRQTTEQLWSDTRRDFRNPINRMNREGFRFELDPTGQHLGEFVKIYHDTMLRVRADPHYFFSGEYFRGLKSALGSGFLLAHTRNPAGEIVSSGIFTQCSGIVQYHLSGNCLGDEGSHGSKLLLHGIRQWAKAQGCEYFHLGGGVGAKNDSLFMFKSGFSSGRATFHTWRVIVDDPVYQRLCRRWETINRMPADLPTGYFPAYRKMLPPPAAQNIRQCA